ncbi:alpha-L-glutamate ligase [Paenibacillus illinoisensis]|uniref:ATP-grasp domain-containing protein n=1 Tax=Paenibacillus illinoisensis TaxID=59845 RepID=UPI003D27A76A
MVKAYVIHENDSWIEPLKQAFEEENIPFEFWHLDHGILDIHQDPPLGVFYNRMSASSHSRGHRFAPEYTSNILAWLEQHDRKVLNEGRALELELSKIKQYLELQAHGVKTPFTVAAVGRDELLRAAKTFPYRPFITKHNRAGKGLGVYLFQQNEDLERYVYGPSFEYPVDGITLLQQYIDNDEQYITRCEFIDGEFYYAIRVDTSEGFELCPADACQIGDQFCPAPGQEVKAKFQVIDLFESPLISQYEALLKKNRISFAGIEFITDQNGLAYTYDINTNTNYNSDAETIAGVHGMRAIARTMGAYLKKL